MKSDLVIVNGELGLVTSAVKIDGIEVKRLSKGYSSTYNPDNVHYVDLPIVGEKDNEKSR